MESPYLQIVPILLYLFARSVFSLVIRPFNSRFKNIMQIFQDLTYFLILVNHLILLAFGSGKFFSEEISNLVFGNLIILGIFLLVAINMLVLLVEMVGNFISLFRKEKKDKSELAKPNLARRDSTHSQMNSEVRGIMGNSGGLHSPSNIVVGKYKKKMTRLGSPSVFKRKFKNPNAKNKNSLNLENGGDMDKNSKGAKVNNTKKKIKVTIKKRNKKGNIFKKPKKAEKIEMENFEEEKG